jgi:purine-binding chemotaxis protein CheW
MNEAGNGKKAMVEQSGGRQLAREKRDRNEVLTEVCSVRLGETLYGIPITHILEIVGGARPERVPLAPEFVGGLVHYRGDVLTTVTVRRLLEMEEQEAAQDILVLEGAHGYFGLLVDAVGEVLTVSSKDYEANPSILEDRRRVILAGAYKLDGQLLVMLDPEHLDPIRLGTAA